MRYAKRWHFGGLFHETIDQAERLTGRHLLPHIHLNLVLEKFVRQKVQAQLGRLAYLSQVAHHSTLMLVILWHGVSIQGYGQTEASLISANREA